MVNWHVAYTKPRTEKKVFQSLLDRGYECYCPLSRTKRKWSDRVKWVEEPVFRSYIFVRIDRKDMGVALQVPGLIKFIFQEGQPAVVRDKEIELIKKFLRDHVNVSARPTTNAVRALKPGQTVRISSGMLMGQKASVFQVRNKEVRVVIKSLGQELVATVDPDVLKSE